MSERSINEHTIMGRLGKDAETRYTPKGTPITTFSVATTETWKDKDGNLQSNTEWHQAVLWDRELLAQYLTSGKRVYLRGRARTRKYQDKEGNDRYITEIVADPSTLILLGDPKGKSDKRNGNPPADEPPVGMGVSDDDVPF